MPKDNRPLFWLGVLLNIVKKDPYFSSFNPNGHELIKQEKCSSLAPPRSKFDKTQWAWQGVKLSQLISIFTSNNVWKFLIKIQLIKSNPKIVRGVNPPCLMPIRFNHASNHNHMGISNIFSVLVTISIHNCFVTKSNNNKNLSEIWIIKILARNWAIMKIIYLIRNKVWCIYFFYSFEESQKVTFLFDRSSSLHV